MPISDSPFCVTNQHKLPTVYTDSAPNSLADCSHPTFPILGDNMELSSTNDWAPNIETIGCSLLNFEVSETETCDDSNFSDGFQNWSNSSFHAEVYLPTSSASPSTTCADMFCDKASAIDCGMQMLSLARNEPTYTVINIHPNAYINSTSCGLSDSSGFPASYLFPQSITDLTVTPNDPNLLEVDEVRCADLNGHEQSFIPYHSVFNDEATQQFSQTVGCIASSIKQPMEDFAVQEVGSNLMWQNESCINAMPSNFSSDGFEVVSAYLPPTSNFVYDVQSCNPECLDNNNYYNQSVSGLPLHGYDGVDEASSLSNYALVHTETGNHDAYYSSATLYSEGFVQLDPGSSNIVYQNDQPNICTNTTILLPSFSGGFIPPEETCIPAYWVSEASPGYSTNQNVNYDQPLVTAPQTISFEGESVNFDCNPVVENVQSVEIPLAPFISSDNQDRSIVNDVQTLCPKTTVFGQHDISLNSIYSGPNSIEFTTVTTVNSANKSTAVTSLAVSKETTSSLKNQKWSCTHCSRSFIRPSHLVDHMRTHTGERPFSCALCGRQFTQASNLRRHLSSHKAWPTEPLVSSFETISSKESSIFSPSTSSSGDVNLSTPYLLSCESLPLGKNLHKKVWNCRFCNHSFEKYLRLRAHMVHHKDKQVFACVFTDCQSTFTLPNSLLTHLLEKHQTSQTINPQCRICGQTFHDFMDLVRHCLPKRSGVKYGCSTLIRSSIYWKTSSRHKNLSKLKKSKINNFPNIENDKTKFQLIPLQTANNSPISYRCPICNEVCARVKGIRQHLLSFHADLLLSQADDLRAINDKSFIEKFCLNMPSTNSINKSLSTVLSNETSLFLLRLENYVTKDNALLEKQVVQSESVQTRKFPVKKSSFICRICNKVFSKRKFFDDHEVMCKQLTEERARRVRLRAFKQTKFRISADEDISTVADAVKSSGENQLPKQNSESNIDSTGCLPTRRSTRNKTFRVFWKPKRTKPDFGSIRVATNSIPIPRLSVKASSALQFDILYECSKSRARRCQLWLPHCPAGPVETPVFMPVGTQGSMKGITVSQLESLDCRIILGNTYHLGHRPGPEVLRKTGGLHKFMSWPRAILTDSGGFQMVSLNKLSTVTEEGVKFTSPHNATEMLLTPEESVGNLQNALGADIVMQLDHVVHVLTDFESMNDAMHRSIRWLDKSIEAHKKQDDKQNLFAITQGGLNPSLRIECITEMLKRKDKLPGFAIGGLSGGEAKDDFWRTVRLATEHLPRNRPRYLMGVGFPVDLIVCVALGCDMFDCVFPTRTGRFGHALVPWGQLNLRQAKYADDFRPIDDTCPCPVCMRPLSRAWIHSALSGRQVSSSAAVSLHNLAYMLGLMKKVREALASDTFPQFVREFFQSRCYMGYEGQELVEYDGSRPSLWACEALRTVGIDISDIGVDQFNSQFNNKEKIDETAKRSRNSSVNYNIVDSTVNE